MSVEVEQDINPILREPGISVVTWDEKLTIVRTSLVCRDKGSVVFFIDIFESRG
jgi:hypothetical protein